VVVSNVFFFTPIPGKMIQFDYHIFEMGWFNHQRVSLFRIKRFSAQLPPSSSTND